MSTVVLLTRLTSAAIRQSSGRGFSTSRTSHSKKHYQLLVVGGGSGGCATAAKFARKLGKGHVAVVDPSEVSLAYSLRVVGRMFAEQPL